MTATPGYVAISRRTLDLEDYIDIARRHAAWIIGPVFAALVIATVVAFVLPNTYVSQAEMQITPAQISQNIVASTVNQQLTERILQMENEILSRTSLSAIIQDPRLDLYKSDRNSKPLEDVIETMRDRDIRISVIALPGNGDRRASAFTISFSYPDRSKAQQTVQSLVSKFEDANQTSQRNQQDVVKSFVHDELTVAKAKLDEIESQMTKFRVDNSGKLPEQSNLNIAQLTSLQQQAATINDALNRLAQERVQLDTHLQTLQSQLALVSSFEKEPPPLPDPPVVRQQNERLTALNKVINDTESQLAQLHQIYSPKYPDIRDAENRLAVLRKERDELQQRQDEVAAKPKEPAAKTPDPAAARSASAIQGQIDATKASIQALEMERGNRGKQQQSVNQQIESYQERLSATSSLEAKYADLVRDQRSAAEKYQELQNKQQLADQNGELLQRKAGENLELLDPPSLPMAPAKPNRWMIVGVGVSIGFVLGLALAGVQEAKDTSLKNLKDVRAYTNLPVLSSIPLLENTILVRRKRRLAFLAWTAAVIIGMIAVSASLYYHWATTAI